MSKLESLARRLDQALSNARRARLACLDVSADRRDLAVCAAVAAHARAQALRVEYGQVVLGRRGS